MVSVKRHAISTFVTKTLWIFFIIFHQFNLVTCNELEDDNLKKALEAIERRQRDLELQENDYYGQPEDIGYGFQKTLGFFDGTGPAAEIGSFDSDPRTDNDYQNFLYNYQRERESEKRKSNFRERLTDEDRPTYSANGREDSVEYLKMLQNLWSKYRQSRNDDLGLEDLTDEQLEDVLNAMNDGENGDEEVFDTGDSESNGLRPYETVPIRPRKNYRVFEGLRGKSKRYPSFGEGIYGKRSSRSNYDNLPERDFQFSLKYASPEGNRDRMDVVRENGYEDLDKDRDLARILNGVANRPEDEYEPYWRKDQGTYEDDVWLQGPASFQDETYEPAGRSEKRTEPSPKFFKQHNGIRLTAKRFPVKRSTVRVRKEVNSEKVAKELKNIFDTSTTTTTTTTTASPSKKATTKKTTEPAKKQNVTKPAVTKHRETKKVVVRSADKSAKEERRRNEEIENVFRVDKKSIDWSQYFGLDKRYRSNWLNNDYRTRAESHFLGPPKTKRHQDEDRGGKGRVVLERSNYQIPFDTRRFNKKGHPTEIDNNIDKVETKIGDIEDKIIDDAVKYTGAHSGATGEDFDRVKGRVIQHLEAAYSLEKMKNALEEFKNLIKPARGATVLETPKKSVTEAPASEPPQTTSSGSKESANLEKPLLDKKPVSEVSKRPAVKKEGVQDIFGPEPGNLEFLNDGPAFQYENEECPVLDQVLRNCLRLEEMGGKYAELLVPLCSLQQICYYCGAEIGFSKMSMCDSMYLTEAQNICQDNRECLVSARDSLMGLRDFYEQELMNKKGGRLSSGSCLSNPCIQRYFLNSPGAVYSLEVQK